MSGANSFGNRLRLTTFGESHGIALGAVIDGVPAGIRWRDDILQTELERRRPGTSAVVSARGELDKPEILSGVYQERTLGTPIAMIVRNHDARSEDYAEIAREPRAGHADDVWKMKFGHSDPRGGGRSSGRETLARVMGGAVARMILSDMAPEMSVRGFSRRIGPYELSPADLKALPSRADAIDTFTARFPSRELESKVTSLLQSAKSEGLSYGGVAELRIEGVPPGLGQPVFHKLKADLASAMLGVGATSAVEIGAGMEAVLAEGSVFHKAGDQERYGGIRGGISTGEPIVLRVGFKPTSSVLDVAKKGRHDPCIVPRAIPVLEAMVCLVLADHLLWAKSDHL